jgi:MFS family permease
VISGYALAYAALLITGARMGDDHGHRRLFLGGLAGFTLMSLVAGLAWSTPVLIAARIGQGVAAAAMGPQVMTVIQLTDGGGDRERVRTCGDRMRRAEPRGRRLRARARPR